MSKNRMAPPIRFQGFTEPWEQRKLGEIAEYKKGPFGSALKKDFFIPDSATSVKVYEQQNAINKNWNLSRYYISKEYAQKLKSFEVHAGDIIVSCAGTIGEIYELPAQSRSGIINQALMRIRVNEDIVCKDIFKLAFSNMIDSFSREFSNGSAIKNIPPFADLKPMKILLPNKAEQTIIGDFFTDIDKTITLHQHKLEQQKKLKKYFLQNMFPEEGETVPRIRFKEFIGDWEQRKLGDISSVIDPHPSHRAPAETQTGIPFIGIGDVDEAGNIDYSTARIVDEKIYEEHHKRYDLAIPSVGIGRVASLGKVIRLRTDIGKYAVSPTMSIIQFSQEVDVNYMYSCMSSPYFQQQFTAQSSGSTRQSVGIQDLRRFMIPIPQNKIEQINIGMFFWKLDSIITHHQRKIDQLQAVKKFMLQNMFI